MFNLNFSSVVFRSTCIGLLSMLLANHAMAQIPPVAGSVAAPASQQSRATEDPLGGSDSKPAHQSSPARVARTAATSPEPAAQVAAMTSTRINTNASAVSIQQINEQMTVMQAQLSQLELQAKIGAKRNEINQQTSGSSFGGKNVTPAVLSVAGITGKLEAVLVFPGGVTQRVQEGDVIESRRVTKIAVNEVVLTDLKDKKSQRLAFVNTAPSNSAQMTPGTYPAVTSMPGR